jgi:hypothetical protein
MVYNAVCGGQLHAWYTIWFVLDWQKYLVLNGCGGGESLQRIEGRVVALCLFRGYILAANLSLSSS